MAGEGDAGSPPDGRSQVSRHVPFVTYFCSATGKFTSRHVAFNALFCKRTGKPLIRIHHGCTTRCAGGRVSPRSQHKSSCLWLAAHGVLPCLVFTHAVTGARNHGLATGHHTKKQNPRQNQSELLFSLWFKGTAVSR